MPYFVRYNNLPNNKDFDLCAVVLAIFWDDGISTVLIVTLRQLAEENNAEHVAGVLVLNLSAGEDKKGGKIDTPSGMKRST